MQISNYERFSSSRINRRNRFLRKGDETQDDEYLDDLLFSWRLSGDDLVSVSGRLEMEDQALINFLSDEGIAAGEDVDGGVLMLWPGVDGDVALGDDDDSAEAVWIELMDGGFHDGGARVYGSLMQDFF